MVICTGTLLTGRYIFCGTVPRLLGAVINGHPVLWSPDFPLPAEAGSDRLIYFSPRFSLVRHQCLGWRADPRVGSILEAHEEYDTNRDDATNP